MNVHQIRCKLKDAACCHINIKLNKARDRERQDKTGRRAETENCLISGANVIFTSQVDKQLNVSGKERDAFGVNRQQVGVLESAGEVALGRFPQRLDRHRSHAEVLASDLVDDLAHLMCMNSISAIRSILFFKR